MLSSYLAKKEKELKEVLNSKINAVTDKYTKGMAKSYLEDKPDMAIRYNSLIAANLIVQGYFLGYDMEFH